MPGGYHDQARMTINSSGTTTFSLSAAVSPFNTFANAGVITGETIPYGAIDGTAGSEQGWGLYLSTGSSTGGPSLTRNVTQSTNGNNPISASSSNTQVFINPGVMDLVQLSLTAQANLGGL